MYHAFQKACTPYSALFCTGVWCVHRISFIIRQTLPALHILLLSLPKNTTRSIYLHASTLYVPQHSNKNPWLRGPQQTTLYGQVAHCNMSQGMVPSQPLLNFGPAAHNLKYKNSEKNKIKSHMGPHRVCKENSANSP